MRELQNNLAHTLLNFVNPRCRNLIILRCNNFQSWCDAHAWHYAHARAVWCSWCTLEWPGYPYDELVTARAIKGREGIWVASRFLTTKMPSALLVTITWLQHTWCPRFRRGTYGYGITTSPTREVEYEYGVFMRMHVSIPTLPKCICYATHTQKVTFILIHKVVSKTKRISLGLRNRLDLWLAWNFRTTELDWSQLA
jgi:hypothetical protein